MAQNEFIDDWYDRYRAVAVTLCGSAFFERCW
jgi:hypothetical protein